MSSDVGRLHTLRMRLPIFIPHCERRVYMAENNIPKNRRNPKPKPEITEEARPLPKEKELDKSLPVESELNKDLPEAKELNKELPPIINPENIIHIGDRDIEIKPTKLFYQRNRTAAAYRILEVYPLPDVLAMEKGILDPDRDGDAIVFDFLIAVFDNKEGKPDPTGTAEMVREYYDTMTSEDVDRAVQIFKRLNHIEDKEEAAKNRAAKGTSK